MTFWMFLLFPAWLAHANPSQVEAFIIQIQDRSISVLAPDKKKTHYAVIVENRSLSDQVGRFEVEGKLLKFIAIKSGKSETVELDNKSSNNLVFVPVSPAFQDVELIFGKKAYEIPPKE